MSKFIVDCSWEMYGHVEVEAENVDENGCGELQGLDNDGDGIDDNLENQICIYDPDNNPNTVDITPTPAGLDSPYVFTEGPYIGCIKGDLNLDGDVGFSDVLALSNQYAERVNYNFEENPLPLDLEADSDLDFPDVLAFITAYGYR